MTFSMWSFGHYVFMISPFIFTGLFYALMRHKSREQKRKFGIWLSIIMIVILFLRNGEILVRNGFQFDYEVIPLQICHFANFVLLYAFIKDSKSVFSLALLLNFPAAMVSIIFANSLSNYDTILTFRGFAYIFGHLLIVATTLWAYLAGFVTLNKETFKANLFIVYVLYIVSLLVNNLIGSLSGNYSNYFYTMKPERGTPLEWFYNWGMNIHFGNFIINPLYILLHALLATVVIFAMYGIFKTIDLAKEPKLTLASKNQSSQIKI